MSGDSMPKFAFLNTNNYYLWGDNMEAALQLKELWSAVTEDAAFTALSNPEKAKLQAKARAVIVLMVSDSIKPMIPYGYRMLGYSPRLIFNC